MRNLELEKAFDFGRGAKQRKSQSSALDLSELDRVLQIEILRASRPRTDAKGPYG